MDFADQNANSPLLANDQISDATEERSFKHCLLSSVWTQSRLVASLLDQIGLTYHRVFDNQALELFLLLINTELPSCYALEKFSTSSLRVLNRDLLTIQSKLISSMDLFVVKALENADKQREIASTFHRLQGKHNRWKLCAKTRFEQVICPILEQKLVRKTT